MGRGRRDFALTERRKTNILKKVLTEVDRADTEVSHQKFCVAVKHKNIFRIRKQERPGRYHVIEITYFLVLLCKRRK